MDHKALIDPWIARLGAWLLTWAPAFGGSVVSLAFVGQLTTAGRIMTVLVGTLSAIFLAPAVIDGLRLLAPWMPHSFDSALKFLVSLSAMGTLPSLLDWIKTLAGDPWGIIGRLLHSKDPAQ